MRLGRNTGRVAYARERDVDDLGFAFVIAEERASASRTERTRSLVRRLIPRESRFTLDQAELILRSREPSDEGGTVIPLAHRAVAVDAKARRQIDLELDRTA
jgi:hypothetical protein